MKKVVFLSALISMSVVEAISPIKTAVVAFVAGYATAQRKEIAQFVERNQQTIEHGVEQLPQKVQTVIANAKNRTGEVAEMVLQKKENLREWVLTQLESDEETAARHELFGINKIQQVVDGTKENAQAEDAEEARVKSLQEQGFVEQCTQAPQDSTH